MSATLKYISCPVSQLDLLEPIGVQTQVDSFKDIEYLPTSAIQDGAPITFEIGKDERYTDASEFVIKTMVEIQGENGTALTGKQFTNAEAAGTLEKVGVINNLGHSLWEQIVLLINDTKVTESSNNYAYKAMLETLLSYDDVDEKSVLRLFVLFQERPRKRNCRLSYSNTCKQWTRDTFSLFRRWEKSDTYHTSKNRFVSTTSLIPDQCKREFSTDTWHHFCQT